MTIPSFFGMAFPTTMPSMKYDDKGRQMRFEETEVQRLERLAFMGVSKDKGSPLSSSPSSSSSSTLSSPTLSPSLTPRMKLISEPYSDPIELMANRLAEEFMLDSPDELSPSSSEDEPHYFYSSSPPVISCPRSTNSRSRSTSGVTVHKRKKTSLFAIVEED